MKQSEWVCRDEREPVEIPGHVVMCGGERVEMQITDLSSVGCQILANRTLPIAQQVQVEIADQFLVARVRWAFAGKAGLKFEGLSFPAKANVAAKIGVMDEPMLSPTVTPR